MERSKFGSPTEVKFCKNCVESNQRFVSSVQHKMVEGEKKDTALFDEDGICLSCKYFERKEKFDWNLKEKELKDILDQHRSQDGSYDVVVPGSGGKDSVKVAHTLKYKYGMNPLTVTWAPHMYTDVGRRNLQSWIDTGGFDNLLFTANGQVMRKLTYEAFQNLYFPFQPFKFGIKFWATKMAIKFGINPSESVTGSFPSK